MEHAQHAAAPATDAQKAALIIERLLNNSLFPHGSKDHPQFLNAKVAIGVGLEREKEFGPKTDEKREVLRFTLHEMHVDTIPAAVSGQALKTLGQLPVLAQYVEFASEKDKVAHLKETLTRFIDQGADLPRALLQWNGFAEDKPGEYRYTPEYALEIRKDATGLTLSVDAQADGGRDAASLVRDSLTQRLPEIRKTLAERVIKYEGIADEAGKAAVTTAINQLQIVVESNDASGAGMANTGVSRGSARLILRSLQQAEAERQQKANPALQLDQKALEASNILFSLTPEQLGKIGGRAVLFAGEGAMDVFPYVAGRKDMQSALAKSLTRLKAAKPAMATEIDEFLASDQFKNPWKEAKEIKSVPEVTKDPSKPGEMTIDFTLPANKANEIIQAIAGLDKGQAAAAPPVQAQVQPVAMPKPHPLHFAHVDQVHLLGVTSQQALNTALSLFHPAPAAKGGDGASLEDTIKPLAEKLIQSVEEAHHAIEQALATAGHAQAAQPAPPQPAGRIVQASQTQRWATRISAETVQPGTPSLN